MPPLTGVLLLLLVLAAIELVCWSIRRRAWRRERARPHPNRALPPAPTRRAPRHQEPSRACVVLVHGFAGFDELRLAGRSVSYFRGVREHLAARGIACTVPRLPAVASIEERASVLGAALARLAHLEVHVIAHSMGGLDARFAIASARAELPWVRSLVTIATPHRGTPLATLGARLLSGSRLADLERAVKDLVPSRLAALGDVMRDVEGVRYASVLAAPRASAVHPLLVPTHRLLSRLCGDNDGIVPVMSQRWGEVLGEVDADHWGAVGWGGGFDAPALYASLVERVRHVDLELHAASS